MNGLNFGGKGGIPPSFNDGKEKVKMNLSRWFIKSAVFFLVAGAYGMGGFCQDLVTIDGDFKALVIDNQNFKPDGTMKPIQGNVGEVVYEVRILSGPNGFSKSIFFPKAFRPGTNQMVLGLTGENALPVEGDYQLAVIVWNRFPDGRGKSVGPKYTLSVRYEKPIPDWVPLPLEVGDVALEDETDFQ